MLPLYLRALLIIGAVLALVMVGHQVKKSRILVEDAVFWVVLSAILVLLAMFPDVAINMAYSLGFISASNFIYLIVIVLLLWKVFTNSSEISRLKAKVNELAQEIALMNMKEREDNGPAESDCERKL